MRRSLNAKELQLLRADEKALLDFCKKHKLLNKSFYQKYNGIRFEYVDNINGYELAAGSAEGNPTNNQERVVQIQRKILNNNIKRRGTMFHEVGHFLFGISKVDLNKEKNVKVLKKIISARKKYPHILTLPAEKYLNGLKLLEEHIVDKFSIKSAYESYNQKPVVHENLRHILTADYTFNTTFNSSYGIFESICDNLIYKKYKSYDDVFKECLNDKFYMNLFKNYPEMKLMKILGDLGEFYDVIYKYAQTRNTGNPRHNKKILEGVKAEISTIRGKKHTITPEEICLTSIECMEQNPGVISSGENYSRNIFMNIRDENIRNR